MKQLLSDLRITGLLTVSFIALMIIGSSFEGSSIPKSYIFTLDKLLHILEYYIFGTLLFFIFLSASQKPDIISLIIGIFYSFIDELYQSTVDGRDSSILDVFADIIGLILGLVSIKILFNSFIYDK
tara:strand:- start:169 stop:546 length:378 start_codon:yes stop_codon:yes gene_type:complete